MKTLITTFISLLSLSAFAEEELPLVTNSSGKEPASSIISDAKQVLLNNLDDLSKLEGISIYTIGSYVVPFDGGTPEGFGAGIGLDYELGSGIEIQLRGLWNDDNDSGEAYTADIALAYRMDFDNASAYVRGLVGYRESIRMETLSSEMFTGAAIGFDIKTSDSTSIKIEPGILYSNDSEFVFSIVAGVKLTF